MKEISQRLAEQNVKEREESKAAKSALYTKRNETKEEIKRLNQLKEFKVNVRLATVSICLTVVIVAVPLFFRPC